MRSFALALIGILTAKGPVWAQSDGTGECENYKSVPLPAESAVATPTKSPDCESYKSYAGIGRPIDYVSARSCAWRERAAEKAGLRQNAKAPIAWVVGGSLILADLYSNGMGVDQNLPLALRLACEQSDGLLSDAIQDLKARQTAKGNDTKPIELCDYAASTFEMNFCAAFSLQKNNARRGESLERISESWTQAQKDAFKHVRDAFAQYASNVARHETYRGGTIRDIRAIGVEEDLHASFVTDLQSYEQGKLPFDSSPDYQNADKSLNRVYAKAVGAASAPQEYPDEVVQPEEIQITERSWLTYRDAWTNFARLRYPSTSAKRWVTFLTTQRTNRLTLVLCGFNDKDALCTKTILDELNP